MAKKYWISVPLVTASEANDAAVVSFLKGGLKKRLEVETATFITKWMSDKSVPFHIDVEHSSPERNRVAATSPQGEFDGVTVVPVAAETDTVANAGDAADHTADTAGPQIAEGAAIAAEPAGEQPEATTDEPASQPNASGVTGLRRSRGKAGRRVPEASEAEK